MKDFTMLDVFDLICTRVAETGNGISYADIRDHFDARENPMKVRNALKKLKEKGLIGNNPETKLWVLDEDGYATETWRQIYDEVQIDPYRTFEPGDLYGGYDGERRGSFWHER